MPRRSQRDEIRSFATFLAARWSVICTERVQPLLAVGTHVCARCCLVDESDVSSRDRFAGVTVASSSPETQQRHHTFLVPETCVLTGFIAEVSAEFNSVLLPELAWNVAVWERLSQLELRLGYKFKEKALLREAFTSSAFLHTLDDQQQAPLPPMGDASSNGSSTLGSGSAALGARRSYERVEWLGDAVLHALASLHVFYSMPPGTSAASLSERRSTLCSNSHLHQVSQRMGLGEMILLSCTEASGRSKVSLGATRKMEADLVEALLGSIYLEGGWSRAVDFFEDFILNQDLASSWHAEMWTSVHASEDVGRRVRGACVAAEAALGRTFGGQKACLQHALLHPSSSSSSTHLRPQPSSLPNQFNRLEFLGDALLGMAVSEELYGRYVEDSEFHLTERRAAIVCNESLYEAARSMALDRIVVHEPTNLTGPDGKWLADSFEALVAAIYFEGGLVAVKTFVSERLSLEARGGGDEAERPAKRARSSAPTHPKNVLQNARAALGKAAPEYVVVDRSHGQAKVVVECRMDGMVAGRGEGWDFKEASTESAREAIERAEEHQPSPPLPPPPQQTLGEAGGSSAAPPPKHPKAELNELVQQRRLGACSYRIVEDRGPKHDPPLQRFVVEVRLDERVLGHGIGRNNKDASLEAAIEALRVLRAEL